MSAIRKSPDTWNHWLKLCDAIQADDLELTVEEFAGFYAEFKRLERVGVPFDESFVRCVEELNDGAKGSDDDADADAADDGVECDDGANSFCGGDTDLHFANRIMPVRKGGANVTQD